MSDDGGQAPEPSWLNYWVDVEERVETALAKGLWEDVHVGIRSCVGVYAHTWNGFDKKATQHVDCCLPSLGIMTLHTYDVLRALPPAFATRSPASVAVLARVAFETYANFLFIKKSATPCTFADRFFRYQWVERLRQAEEAPAAGRHPLLSPELEAKARANAAEWLRQDGTLDGRVKDTWTAEEASKSLKKRAVAAGLAGEYAGHYSPTSKYVHGSALLMNVYPNGFPVGNQMQCAELSCLGATWGLEFLREACGFFRTPDDTDEMQRVVAQLMLSVKRRAG